jgi:hypothetical protein
MCLHVNHSVQLTATHASAGDTVNDLLLGEVEQLSSLDLVVTLDGTGC